MTKSARGLIYAVFSSVLILASSAMQAQFTWSNVGGTSATDGVVRAIASEISTGNIYVGGDFTSVVGTSANYIASWDGTSWSALGSGLNGPVRSITASGGTVYVGGDFTTAGGGGANYVASWDGTSWSALGSGTDNAVDGLKVSGGSLYAAGQFQNAGGSSANRIAVWNGSAWSTLGSGLSGRATCVDVSGSDVYVGGFFVSAGVTTVNRVAHWNGSAWSALGTGVNASVSTVTINGSDVYFGGSFTDASGTSANRIAVWNGSAWAALGSGVNSTVSAAKIYLNEVYIGGFFTSSGGDAVNRLAKWDGTTWNPIGSGADNIVRALQVRDSEGAMYVGGDFATAGGVTADKIARFTDTDNPLPVALSSFSATAGVGEVVLKWATESENNNDAFLVERGEDGENFALIAELEGQGTTNGRTEYEYVDRFVANGTTYHYRLVDRDFNGVITYHQIKTATPSSIGDALDQKNPVALSFELHPNFPNPFNPETTVRFEIPSTTESLKTVSLRIYNSIGQQVRSLYDGPLSGGVYEMHWDGTSNLGVQQPSGIYFLQLKNGAVAKTQKMLLSR